MKILPTGIIDPIDYISSSHCDDRPDQAIIDMIVIHNISLPPGKFGQGHVENFFCGQLAVDAHPYFVTIAQLKVSAHIFIDRKGHMQQFVPFSKRAWHAGQSHFHEKTHCNDFSIGIELEGTDDLPYESIQYIQLAALIKLCMATYRAITADRIVGHGDIAPSRKTDPGPAFDWEHLRRLIRVKRQRF